jgi:uncharacterized protein YggT (Ycf19 family)
MQDPNERRVVQEEIVQTPEGANAAVVENRVRVMPTPAEVQVGRLERTKQIVWLIVGLICALIALRFVLLAMGANTDQGFGQFLLTITQPFVAPFLPLFGEQQASVEYSDLIAIAVYLLLGWIINRVLELVMAPRTPPTY